MASNSSSESEDQPARQFPIYIRSCSTPPGYHPAQIARAQLADTKGAVFLPLSDSRPSPISNSTTLSIFRQSTVPVPPNQRLSVPTPSTLPNPPSHKRQSLNIDSLDSKVNGSRGLPRRSLADEQTEVTSVESLFPGRILLNGISTKSVKRRIGSSMDGSTDEPTNAINMATKNNRDTTMKSPDGKADELLKVHFSSDEVTRVRCKPKFLNPFSMDLSASERRLSDISDTSDYLRPNAFANYRDTLARLYPTSGCYPGAFEKTARQHRTKSCNFSNIDRKQFLSHRDTLTRLYLDRNASKTILTQVLNNILVYLSFTDYKNLRLSCRQWCDALPQPRMPGSYRVPAEILQQVYQYLQPSEFDAARHTCQSWFLASLNYRLGSEMMELAGCRSAVLTDLEHRQKILQKHHLDIFQHIPGYEDEQDEIDECTKADGMSEEWLISKRLATECKLSSAWHGNASKDCPDHGVSRFSISDIVSFNKLACPFQIDNHSATRFTVSVCGKFVLVVTGSDILVYKFSTPGHILHPCVRLNTEGEVLKVSMDTSSGRYAVAALLNKRMGMVWDLGDLFEGPTTCQNNGEPISLGMLTDVCGSILDTDAALVSLPLLDYYPERRLDSRTQQQFDSLSASSMPPVSARLGSIATSSSQSSNHRSSFDYISTGSHPYCNSRSITPIKTKPTHLYRNLGCSADEPRSVAICPQRKCVAFGCRTGIELHWTDALTGRDLNRWFPLAAPGDHLYFLPQRIGVDSVNKLRLLSSATSPACRITNRHNSAPSEIVITPIDGLGGRQRSMTRFFFGNMPFPPGFNAVDGEDVNNAANTSGGILRTVGCDHYQAVPLSDGLHILFTDPMTGLLCLGSDAPLGGPTKFNRDVFMIPPKLLNIELGAVSCYRAGRDLSWGVRVVAAYSQGDVVLFNIPRDHFERLQRIRTSNDVWDEMAGVVGQSDLLMDALMDYEMENMSSTQSTPEMPTPDSLPAFRPLHIKGALIHHANSEVEQLLVESEFGGLRIWLFERSGIVTRLDIYVPRNAQTRFHVIGVDGLPQLKEQSRKARNDHSNEPLDKDTEADLNRMDSKGKHAVRFPCLDGTFKRHSSAESSTP